MTRSLPIRRCWCRRSCSHKAALVSPLPHAGEGPGGGAGAARAAGGGLPPPAAGGGGGGGGGGPVQRTESSVTPSPQPSPIHGRGGRSRMASANYWYLRFL